MQFSRLQRMENSIQKICKSVLHNNRGQRLKLVDSLRANAILRVGLRQILRECLRVGSHFQLP